MYGNQHNFHVHLFSSCLSQESGLTWLSQDEQWAIDHIHEAKAYNLHAYAHILQDKIGYTPLKFAI